MTQTHIELELPVAEIPRSRMAIPLAKQQRLYKFVLMLSDFFMLIAAFAAAYWGRFAAPLGIFQSEGDPAPQLYSALSVGLVVLWLIILSTAGLYNRRNLLGGTNEYERVFGVSTIGTLAVVLIEFFVIELVVARGWLILVWALTFGLVAVGRFALRRGVYAARRRGYMITPTLLVGANDEAEALAIDLLEWQTSGLHVVGCAADSLPAGTRLADRLPNLGRLAEIDTLVHQHSIQEIVVATSALSRDQIVDLFKRYGLRDDIDLNMSSGLFELVTTGLSLKEIAAVPLVRINQVKLSGLDQLLKTSLDLLVGGLAILLGLPVFVFIALAIRLSSPGPIIYRRRVMGLNGRQFDAFKFRTMVVNGDEVLAQYPELQEELATTHKLKNDPRVTRIGKVLRKLSLDELPQLFNVMRREMSVVGPRMISPAEVDEYGQWGVNLLTVRPGITGLWQVSGRSDVSYAERVRIDMSYIRNWSIWLDLQILWQTIPAVLQSRGAY